MPGFFFSLSVIVTTVPLALGIILSRVAFSRLFYAIMFFLTGQILIGTFTAGSLNQSAMIYILLSNWIALLYLFFEIKFDIAQRIARNANLYSSAGNHPMGLYALILALSAIFLLVESMGGWSSVGRSWLFIRAEVSSNVIERVAANILFFLSASTLIIARIRGSSTLLVVIVATLLLVFCLLIRVKIYFIPIAIALFIPLSQRVNLRRFVSFGAFFVLAYVFIMTFRWVGDLEGASAERLLDVLTNVFDAGLEREAYHQFISVFEYYESGGRPLFSSISRYFLIALDRVAGTSLSPDNPMYMFSTISNGMIYEAGGSAHPTIYGDSFAQAGWLGVFWPVTLCFMMTLMFLIPTTSVKQAVSSVFIYFSMILFVRGSSFYALLHLTPVFLVIGSVAIYKIYIQRYFTSVDSYAQ